MDPQAAAVIASLVREHTALLEKHADLQQSQIDLLNDADTFLSDATTHALAKATAEQAHDAVLKEKLEQTQELQRHVSTLLQDKLDLVEQKISLLEKYTALSNETDELHEKIVTLLEEKKDLLEQNDTLLQKITALIKENSKLNRKNTDLIKASQGTLHSSNQTAVCLQDKVEEWKAPEVFRAAADTHEEETQELRREGRNPGVAGVAPPERLGELEGKESMAEHVGGGTDGDRGI